MGQCETCGNQYEKSFDITVGAKRHTFDSFECAIHALAPRCARCGTRIVGHGIEADDAIYCCAHCSTAAGQPGAVDNLES